VPHKGLDLLIEALACSEFTNAVRLDVWGGGNTKPYEDLITKLGIGDQVQFLGMFPGKKEGAELMASYDGLAFTPTGNEGLPLVLLEAMAYGLPFLTTSVAAIPDCCLGNPDAVMVQPSARDIRSGLREFVRRLGQREFSGERQQQFYQSYFSPAVMAQRWEECFNDPYRFFYNDRAD
jgi:glycosyltransferase involved in cell wall biosynthesis